jgi:FixJ family two-component response regulator
MTREPIVFIVDDDAAFLESLSVLVSSLGFRTRTYSSADDYLAAFNPDEPGCLLLDVRMPKMSGLALQQHLATLPICPAIVVMTAHADVPTALRAMRQGAIDLLQKAFSESDLYDALTKAIAHDADHRAAYKRQQEVARLFSQLSKGELDVLQEVVNGAANKRIASILGISTRTVEDRRARVMEKLGVDSIAELVRLALEAGIQIKS